jgi:hypothetical protein
MLLLQQQGMMTPPGLNVFSNLLAAIHDGGDPVKSAAFTSLQLFSFVVFIFTLELYSGSLRLYNFCNVLLNETVFRLLKKIVKTLESKCSSTFVSAFVVSIEGFINNESYHRNQKLKDRQTATARHYALEFLHFETNSD